MKLRELNRAAALLLSLTGAQAGSVPNASVSATSVLAVRVLVEARPELTFNRQVPSVLILTTPWGTQTASLNSGTLYPADPQHYWSRLSPVQLRVKVPAGTPPGRYPVSVRTELYVCDQNVHLCSVRPATAEGELELGADAVAPTSRLTLTLGIPRLRGF